MCDFGWIRAIVSIRVLIAFQQVEKKCGARYYISRLSAQPNASHGHYVSPGN